jgi:hypothetical protein
MTATRRGLIATAAAAPLALAGMARAADDPDRERGERAFRAAIEGEQATAVAFEAIANSDQLLEEHVETMRVLLGHARAHVEELVDLFEQQTGDDPPLAPSRAQIEGLDDLRGERAALRLALRLSEKAVALHLDAMRLYRNTSMLRLVAGAMGTDAQHLALLRSLLGEEPVPQAFERGA